MTTRSNRLACILLRSAAEPPERFEGVAALAARIHDLCGGQPIYLRRGVVAGADKDGEAWQREMIAVRLADEQAGAGALGYAVIGEPALPGAVQYDLLGAALTRIFPAEAA